MNREQLVLLAWELDGVLSDLSSIETNKGCLMRIENVRDTLAEAVYEKKPKPVIEMTNCNSPVCVRAGRCTCYEKKPEARTMPPPAEVYTFMHDHGEGDVEKKFVYMDEYKDLRSYAHESERKLAAAQAQRDKAVAALKYYLRAAEKREKEASAIIESLAADIHITLPFRNYTEMSPKDCYEQGVMDGVAALKSQINAAIDAARGEKK